MTKKYRLLDTFCKAGGAGMGYHLAGFEVVGVDIEPQKRYPFEFHQGDALGFIEKYGKEFDVIHASPPCQRYSHETPMAYRNNHPDLIIPTREALISTGKFYVIENVSGARKYLVSPTMLCGTMFGLPIFRHRFFEINPNVLFLTQTCRHDIIPVLVSGTCRRKGKDGTIRFEYTTRERAEAMKIDWMIGVELDEAIPPAYTKWIGEQLIRILENE